jgi:hypothetical protein
LIDAARVALVRARLDDDAIRVRIAESSDALRKLGVAPTRSPVVETEISICWPTALPTEDGYRRLADKVAAIERRSRRRRSRAPVQISPGRQDRRN